jgi:hypothetical protein
MLEPYPNLETVHSHTNPALLIVCRSGRRDYMDVPRNQHTFMKSIP